MAERFPEGSQISDNEDECSKFLFSHMVAMTTESRTPGEVRKPRGIAIDSNSGKIYVAEGISSVTIFSEALEFLKTFTLENMKSPWGIVIHNNSLYMTDILRHSVFHFKVTADSLVFINEQGGVGSDIDHYNMPRQLAVSINGYIYVTDCLNHRVKVLDGDLLYIRHISHQSMTRPNDVKLTADKVYILSYSDAQCIHIFSHAGQIIQSLIPRGYGPRAQIGCPYFFCLDIRGNFVISDHFLSQIKVFSEAGRLISRLGLHEIGFERFCLQSPFGVAQTANGKLLVVSQNGEMLLITFSL